MKHLLSTLHTKATLAMMYLPSKPFASKHRFLNSRNAKRAIEVCEHLEFTPHTLFDVGANVSQWAYWLDKKWPRLRVESFECNPDVTPKLGRIHRATLSDMDNPLETRFDTYWAGRPIPQNSILKIDTDPFTPRTLRGFGELINQFRFVAIETCWDNGIDWATRQGANQIITHMSDHGFKNIACLDTDYNEGRSHFCDLGFWKS